jgi:FixJ family two-component response regulator
MNQNLVSVANATNGRWAEQANRADLGVSEVMVKVHRANAMRKLRAKSVAELVRMTDLLGITPVVFVIDDDASLRAALKELFESVGLHVELFGSGDGFLANKRPDATSCVVLDVRLPGISGLKVQEELAKAKTHLPIVFLTGHGDIPMAVHAMKAGAVDFLTKPFRNQDLLDAVTTALEQDRAQRAKEQTNSTIQENFGSLSARERDVVARVAAGGLNKQIAADLGVSEVTVKVHRANAMRKLRAKSVAELVRMTDLLGITPSKAG